MQYKKVQKSSWNEPYSSSSFTKQSCSKMALYRWIKTESRWNKYYYYYILNNNISIIIIINRNDAKGGPRRRSRSQCYCQTRRTLRGRCDGHTGEPCKNKWTDRDASWGWPSSHALGRAHLAATWRILLVNLLSGGDAASAIITLATCYIN